MPHSDQLVEDEYIKMQIQNGILFGEFKKDVVVNLEVAQMVVQTRLKLCNGKSFPTLVDIRNVRGTTMEAREHLACPDAFKHVSAGGILVNSEFTRYMGTAFLSLNHAFKPNKPPAKLFTDIEEATKWLNKYRVIEQPA